MHARTLRFLAPGLAAALAAATALAQEGPPSPKLASVPNPIVGYVVIFLLAAVIIAISLYPSKRQHTDL